MKNKIKFVYFDIGSVMMRWKPLMKTMAKKYKKTPQEVEKIYWNFDEISCRGLITPDELWKRVHKKLKIKDYDLDYRTAITQSFSPIAETHEFAAKLAKQMPIGLLTNIHHGLYNICLSQGFVPKLDYHVVVESCKLGFIKPEKEIYHHAQKMAKVAHEEILFTDDLEENIKGAQALGWQTVLFNTDKPKKSLAEISNLLGI